MAYSDEQLAMMSDEELEAAFMAAKAEEDSPETDIEQEDMTTDVDEVEDDVVELEQSQVDEDSDDNDSLDNEEENESDESSEDVEDDLDGDTDTDNEKTTEDEDESTEDEQPVRRKYKANGKEYEFTEEEIFNKFGHIFGQAMDYTKKMQTIKPWRKTIDAIEQADLTAEDINLAIDVLKGDKDAIASLLKRTGIDALELDTETDTKYQPKDYGRNDVELAIKDIVDEIKDDQEYNITYDILEKQWDSKSREAFIKDPEKIRQLHTDVKSGMFNTISPIANKLKVYDGGKQSDLDYYIEAAQQYFEQQDKASARNAQVEVKTKHREEISKVKEQTKQRTMIKESSNKRKAAAPTKKSAGASKVIDYLDDSEDAFSDWYKKIENAF